MAGDSHTNFNGGAFTAGAVGGALTIAGAAVAGVQNVVAGSREWAEERWADMLHRTECKLRAERHRRIIAEDENVELKAEIRRLRDAPHISRGRAIAKANRP